MTKTQMGIAAASLALAGTVTYTKLSSPKPQAPETKYEKLVKKCVEINTGTKTESECRNVVEKNKDKLDELAKAFGVN